MVATTSDVLWATRHNPDGSEDLVVYVSADVRVTTPLFVRALADGERAHLARRIAARWSERDADAVGGGA